MRKRIEIGRHIKKRRTELMLTAADLARDTGFTRSWIEDIERGKQVIRRWQAMKLSDRIGGSYLDYVVD